MKWGLKGGISIDADSRPLRYVLWCCGSICHQVFTFIQWMADRQSIHNCKISDAWFVPIFVRERDHFEIFANIGYPLTFLLPVLSSLRRLLNYDNFDWKINHQFDRKIQEETRHFPANSILLTPSKPKRSTWPTKLTLLEILLLIHTRNMVL